MQLPTVLVSSVVRSTHQGDSHGGLYLVDLERERFEQVVDWNTADIDWQGRGADRGLRGIAFHADEICIAASDEVFIFDQAFRIVRSFRNRYLKHCHEICIAGDRVYLTSTGYDSVLELDLGTGRFLRGYGLRSLSTATRRRGQVEPHDAVFDPAGTDGPLRGDTVHLNTVHAEGDAIFCAAHRLPRLFTIRGSALQTYANIPVGTHNAQPFRWRGQDLVIANCTAHNAIWLMDLHGRVVRELHIQLYEQSTLLNAHLPHDHARQGFGRGLCALGDGLICAGSSPSTVSVYDLDAEGNEPVKRVNLTKDVRHTVHGLAVWPFGPRASSVRLGSGPQAR